MRAQLAAGLILALTAAAGAVRADNSFDARRADDVAGVVAGHGASGSLAAQEDGKTFFEGQAGDVGFAVYFQDCDAKQLCKSLLFTNAWDEAKLAPALVNRWNAWTTWCPAYLDKDGAPNLWLSVPVSAHTDAGDLGDQVATWTGCLKDFSAFVAAPEQFLAAKTGEMVMVVAAPADAPAAPAPAAPAAPTGPHIIADPTPAAPPPAAAAQAVVSPPTPPAPATSSPAVVALAAVEPSSPAPASPAKAQAAAETAPHALQNVAAASDAPAIVQPVVAAAPAPQPPTAPTPPAPPVVAPVAPPAAPTIVAAASSKPTY